MDIFLQNTLTGKKDLFKPIKNGEVSMYNCGPTVYNYAHIGNLRSYVFADTLKRMFIKNGYEVKQVINITDVGHLNHEGYDDEDKMEKGAKREGKTSREIADFYESSFFEDLKKLNINKENIIFPRATDYIKQQIEMVRTLEEKGYTYKTSDGIYFDTSKFPDYGKLGNINIEGLKEGARITANEEKKNITDFVLWKFSPTDHKREMEWQSPWGVGFPGWHIECSAMSKELLGETFDIHTGGIDHIPVHHNNEIAQSVCANGKPFVHYWMHNAFLTLGENIKMSKSEDNFIRLQTLEDKGFDPLSYRYLLLTARYSSPLQFSWEGLKGAEIALQKLRTKVENIKSDKKADSEISENYKKLFMEFINDDLDTPKALALIWQIIKDDQISDEEKKSLILDFDNVLGLDLEKWIKNKNDFNIPDEIQQLLEQREKARKEKDFQKSDELRGQIERLGFDIKDTENGQQITKK